MATAIHLCIVCGCLPRESQSVAAPGTLWPAELKMFTFWTFTEKVADPCIQMALFVFYFLIICVLVLNY